MFLASKEKRHLRAAALLELRARGYLEPVRPRYRHDGNTVGTEHAGASWLC
jgi:hypothetical protein